MFESLIVTLREGVEAALIVAIVLSYLKKIGRTDLAKSAYIALGAAVAVSILGGIAFKRFEIDEDRFEAATIRRMYDASDYPLPRMAVASPGRAP